MSQKNTLLAFMVTMGCLVSSTAFADVLPSSNEHQIKSCVKIGNLADFKDVALITQVESITSLTPPRGLVEEDKCLEGFYKYNTIKIYAAAKTYLSNKDLQKLDLEKDPNILPANIEFEPAIWHGMVVDNTNALAEQEYTYHIAGYTLNQLILYKSKQLSKYQDGTSNVENFLPPAIAGLRSYWDKPQNPPAPQQSIFKDVSSTHLNYDAIDYLYQNGIVQGYLDLTFRPDQKINRAEFTKIVIESNFDQSLIDDCLKTSTSGTLGNLDYIFFKDVPKNQWFSGPICLARQKNIVTGYPDGTYKPNQDITFVEAAKIIAQTFQLSKTPETGDLKLHPWYEVYVNILTEKKAIPNTIISLSQAISRGEMAEIIYRLKAKITTKPSSALL